ncbi:MAG: TonB-dependent starch-binding outer membrane protein SusC [Anaerophaga sp.]|nr:TonB-dependent starch-binding outer membrane protein SusC [Anaerophaga sp.]
MRLNSDHVIYNNGRFDVLKFGETLNYAYSEKSGIAIGNIYWNSVHDLLVANPLLPCYDEEGNFYDYDDKANNGWQFDGNAGNPIAEYALSTRGNNISKNHNLQMSAYLELQPMENLILRSQFGYKMSGNTYRSYDMLRHLNNNTNVTTETVNQNGGLGYSYTLDNTISYDFNISEHSANIVLGQSAEKWGLGENISSSGQNTIFLSSWDHAYVDNTSPNAVNQMSVGGEPWGRGSLASFFGRLNYNYAETYMASLVMRADGSSNFAPGNRWGYFPSVSAGWVVSNENFMDGTKRVIDFLKIRASWGQNGNQSIDPFQYLTTFAFDDENVYYFGKNKTSATTGAYADILKNPDITWETQEQTDVGLDARLFDTRLGVAFDWYKRTTKDWLVEAPIQAVYGLNAPYINGGDIENSGFELALNWNDKISDFSYRVNLNLAANDNEVVRLANSEGIIHGDANVLSQGTGEMYRVQVGYPVGYFFGYKTAGVFQNWEQVENTPVKYSDSQPGDLIFVDTNDDGQINDADRTMIGNPHPDFNLGFSFNLEYKGFDLFVDTYGAFGHQIAKSYRSFADSPRQNYTTEIFDRWHGEGTSNTLPRLTAGSNRNWQNISDIYIEDADYLKIRTITLGYDFKKLFNTMPLSQARLYVSAQNLYTFTGYSGMDPEIGYGYDNNWVSGIDLGYYPSPRTLMVGVNLKF